MVKPQRAAVRPRIVSPDTGEILLLEDVVAPGRPIALSGGPGSGKSTAVAHIRAVRPDALVFEYGPQDGFLCRAVQMAPWATDEILEYTMARHATMVKPLMRRIASASDWSIAGGIPELIALAVDAMAKDESVADVRSALRRAVAFEVPDLRTRSALSRAVIAALPHRPNLDVLCRTAAVLRLVGDLLEPSLRMLRHEVLCRFVAADRIARDLRRRQPCPYLSERLPHDIVQEVATLVGRDPVALGRVRELLKEGVFLNHPILATIMHACNRGWTPDQDGVVWLAGAHLPKADWRKIRLPFAKLTEAVLDDALLTDAELDDLRGESVSLVRADLHCASLRGALLRRAKLSGADLSFVRADRAIFSGALATCTNFENALLLEARFDGANLIHARFARAELSGAEFARARIAGADFSGANLRRAYLRGRSFRDVSLLGARLTGADLRRSRFADVTWPGAELAEARLNDADLTDASMVRANLQAAVLGGSKLAGIDLEGANLRDADLTGATFHLGTSRSGMLFKGPSEGTRTGFYTDEYHEQSFKRPEDVRVANLRGADLRGARLGNVDFYLVDLRDALYTSEQEAHFRKCRAILSLGVK